MVIKRSNTTLCSLYNLEFTVAQVQRYWWVAFRRRTHTYIALSDRQTASRSCGKCRTELNNNKKKCSLQIFKNARTTRWLVRCFSVSASACSRAQSVVSFALLLCLPMRGSAVMLQTGEILFQIAQVPDRLFALMLRIKARLCARAVCLHMCKN